MPPDPVGDSSRDPKPIAATLQVALVLLALALVIAIAGVPGLQPSAGNGSTALKHGWAERQVARAAPAVPAAAPAAPAATEPRDG